MTEPDAAAARGRAIAELNLGPDREERFDRISRLAARLLDVPVAMVNLVGQTGQWTKSAVGIAGEPVPLADSMCRHVVEPGERAEVSDLRTDDRFRDSIFVTGGPLLRFYAGEPLHAGGRAVGTFCVMDTAPRTLTADERELLAELAAWVEGELNNTALNDLVAELSARQQRMRSLLDAAPEGVLLVEPGGLVQAANAPAERLFGLPHESVAPLPGLLPGLAPDVAPFDAGDAGEPVVAREVTGRHCDGTRFPVEISVAPLRDGGPHRWLVLARDLRPMVRTEVELRRQQRLTALLLESAGDGIIGTDRDGVVLFANRAATELLGRPEHDLVDRPFHDVVHPERPDGSPFPAQECPVHAAVAGDTTRLAEDVYRRRDGEPVHVEATVAPIEIGEEVVGAVTTFRDVTARHEVERLKDELVGVVSHELRTPLTSIKGSLALLAGGVMGPVPEQQQPMLEMAVKNADRLGALLDDILDLDRLDAGRMPLHPLAVDAAELARDVVASLEPAARVAGVELVCDAGPAPGPVVEADPLRMGQALTNLVGNAVKFSDPGSPVAVAVRSEGAEVRIAVRDRGRGIPEDQLGVVFERFRQVDGGPTGNRRGTGLGLSIAQAIVQRSGGRIELESRVGQGSTFTVVLPQAEERQDA